MSLLGFGSGPCKAVTKTTRAFTACAARYFVALGSGKPVRQAGQASWSGLHMEPPLPQAGSMSRKQPRSTAGCYMTQELLLHIFLTSSSGPRTLDAKDADADPPALVACQQARAGGCHWQVWQPWGPRMCWMHCSGGGLAQMLAVAAAPVPPGNWKTPCRNAKQLRHLSFKVALGALQLLR